MQNLANEDCVLNFHFLAIRLLIQIAPFNKYAIELLKTILDCRLTIQDVLRRRTRSSRIYRSACCGRKRIEQFEQVVPIQRVKVESGVRGS
jgi:hypothetical protein